MTLWIIGILLILVVVLLWLHHDKQANATDAARRAANAAITITSSTATKGDINVNLDAIGTVTPVYTVSITSQVTGPVTEVHFKEGQLVHKGELLLEIDSRPFRATLLQAQ